MALSNYSDLITSIQNWMGRDNDTDLSLVAPDLIVLAEQELYTKLRVPENNKLGYIKVDETYEALPADWLEGREVRPLGNCRPLKYQTPQIFDDLNTRGSSNTPQTYTIRENMNIQLGGTLSTTVSETVSSATSAATTVTITTAAAHSLSTDDYITVTDSATEGYAGTFKIASVPTTTTFTYTTTTAPTASPATGTIAYIVNNLELDYFYKWTGLDSTNTTNVIMTNYPDLYLFACLYQAAVWIESIDLANGYYQRFTQALDLSNMRSLDRLMSGSQMEMQNIRGSNDHV